MSDCDLAYLKGINLRLLRLKASDTPHLSCVHLIHIDVIMDHQFKLPNAASTKAFKTPMFNKMQKPFESTAGQGFVMEEHDK